MAAREPDPGFRYWAFISYSHRDKSWGRWLHRALESYRIPRRLVGLPIAAGTTPPRLTPIFRDRDELPTSADLDRSVAEALRQSWCLIVICSPASAQSRWVNEEVLRFRQLGRAERIHCLIVDGSPDAAVEVCLPPALRDRIPTVATAGEPIAADARRGGDGKANARLKLIAGILGLCFDKLVQREHQRRYRRMVAIAGAAVFAFAVLTMFTIVTITSRRDAEAQRNHAESLVEFMLGDLRQKLEPEGKLSTLDAIGKEALAYYAAQDPSRLDADSLARRARALHVIGDVYDQRGRLDDALAVFRKAAASTAELLARDSDNPQRIFDHAQSAYWVGLIAYQRGQVDAAKQAFQQYEQLAERLVGINPDNADWQAELEYANGNLGALLDAEGHTDEAAVLYERALQVALTLAGREPNNATRQFDLAQSHAWLADARANQGRLQDAAAEREAEVAIYEEMLATSPGNHDAKDGLLVAERELGGLSQMQGKIPLAVSQLQRADDLAQEQFAAEPDNTTTIEHFAGASADLGQALGFSGDSIGSRAAIERARKLAAGLVASDPSVVAWQTLFSAILLRQAQLALDGQPLDALRQTQGALQRLDTLRQSHQLDRRARVLYARALLMLGDCQVALGNQSQAHDAWESVVVALRGEAAIASPDANAILAIVLTKLGRNDEALPLLVRLERIGYREPGFARLLAARSAHDSPLKMPSATNGDGHHATGPPVRNTIDKDSP